MPTVKRLLLIFLLTMLPLQFSWSAVAVYCQHEKEQSEQSSHPGHHTHEHQDQAGADTPDGQKKLSVDGDCAICHISAQPSFLTGLPDLASAAPVMHEAEREVFHASHIPEGPHKPDWRLVA